MSDMKWSPAVEAWLAQSWEPAFMVWGPDINDEPEWRVVDAECQTIAVCPTRQMAEVVRDAVDFYNDEMERRRGAELDAWENSPPEMRSTSPKPAEDT